MSATHIHIDGVVLVISLLFASLLALLGSSFYVLNEGIELKLITDVRERLDEEGYQVSIDFDGRDGTIGGNASDDKTIKEIVAITKSVEGVRTIKNEITVSLPQEAILDNSGAGLSGITDAIDKNSSLVESIDNLITSSIPSSAIATEPTADIDNHIVAETKEESLKPLTEITEQPIIKESIILYQGNEVNLSLEHTASLDLILPLLADNTSLFVEMSSFYKDPAIAIKRTDIIKDFFEKKGIDDKHFDVIWSDTPNESKVQIKLFHSK